MRIFRVGGDLCEIFAEVNPRDPYRSDAGT
jgi:hypothetical protein